MPPFSERDRDLVPNLRWEVGLLVKTTAARRNLALHCGKHLRSCLGSQARQQIWSIAAKAFSKGEEFAGVFGLFDDDGCGPSDILITYGQRGEAISSTSN